MNHDELVELVPLLAVDALSAEERDAVRKHIAGCRSCTALLAEYQSVTDKLLQAVPAAAWAPNLETRLRARMLALKAAPPGPAPRRLALPTPARSRWPLVASALALLLLLAFGIGVWWSAQNTPLAV